MTYSLHQIEIPRRNSSCFKGGECLNSGMEYYSLLSHHDEQAVKRCDFCVSCWQKFSEEADLTKGVVYWKSRIEIKKDAEVTQEQSKMGKALSLLRTLLQEQHQQEEEIFVLALFLAHARRLILRKEFEKEGMSYSVYEVANQEDWLMIKKVDLSHLETSVIQKSLSTQLAGN
jgi:hypothetical protein